MNPSMLIAIALRSAARRKMRTFLTMLGIIIGVAAVIAMLAVGGGAQKAINSRIAGLGTNVVTVMPGSFRTGGAHMEAGSSARLEEADAVDIRKKCPSVAAVSPIARTTVQIKAGGENCRTTAWGVYPDYVTIRTLSLSDGTVFADRDVRSAAKVCVIGATVADNLFGSTDGCVGQTIRIGQLPFRVTGVLSAKGESAMGQDQDDIVLIPFSTVQKKILGSTRVNMILASATAPESMDDAKTEITNVLTDRHSGGEGTDFTIRTQSDIAEAAESTAKTLSVLLASIACVSLLVGGIGIMNIMLVSVTERTREIGIRMAVGAKSRDVLLQFLVESILLSVAGGVIGILLGALISFAISTLQGWPVAISLWSVVLGFSFSAAIGIFFGWYPARTAARLNPIEALRYE